MDLTSDIVKSARRGNRTAIVDVLSAHYDPIWRLSAGLTGRADVSVGIVQYIMQRSLDARRSWTDEGAPTRWFHHHTILLIRELLDREPTITNDTLFYTDEKPDPLYVAFVRALRGLPMQQREAFLLSYGEGLNIRAVGIAMDCSMTAAETHLNEAVTRLKGLAGGEYPILLARLADRYRRLMPEQRLSVEDVRKRVRHLLVPWLFKRTIITVIELALLGGLAWAGYWVWQVVRHSM